MVGLQEVYQDEDFVYMVLDYQESGTLLNKIYEGFKFTELQARIIME
jgi:hypothetical protein